MATAHEQRNNPVYKTLNKPLLILGVDRGLFFMSLMFAASLFTSFNTLWGAVISFVVLLLAAKAITRKDPEMIRIIIEGFRYRTEYDPAKYEFKAVRWNRA